MVSRASTEGWGGAQALASFLEAREGWHVADLGGDNKGGGSGGGVGLVNSSKSNSANWFRPGKGSFHRVRWGGGKPSGDFWEERGKRGKVKDNSCFGRFQRGVALRQRPQCAFVCGPSKGVYLELASRKSGGWRQKR